MANIIYNAWLAQLQKSSGNWESTTYKCMLERDTSTYTPDKDHANLAAFTGFVEISVNGYARQTITSPTVTVDNANDKVIIDCADIDFGTLASGQTVKSIIIYRDGADDNNRIPLLRIDTDAGGLLPRELGGGNFKVQIAAEGLLATSQV